MRRSIKCQQRKWTAVSLEQSGWIWFNSHDTLFIHYMGIREGDLGLGGLPNHWFSQPFYNLICTVKPYKRCLTCHWHPKVCRPCYCILSGFLMKDLVAVVCSVQHIQLWCIATYTSFTCKIDGCQVNLIGMNRTPSHFWLFWRGSENDLRRDS